MEKNNNEQGKSAAAAGKESPGAAEAKAKPKTPTERHLESIEAHLHGKFISYRESVFIREHLNIIYSEEDESKKGHMTKELGEKLAVIQKEKNKFISDKKEKEKEEKEKEKEKAKAKVEIPTERQSVSDKRPAAGLEQSKKYGTSEDRGKGIASPKIKLSSPEGSAKYGSKREEKGKGTAAVTAKPEAKPQQLVPKKEERGKNSLTLGDLLQDGKTKRKEEKRASRN